MSIDSPLHRKSFTFAIEIVRVCNVLTKQQEYVLSKQLLKSGTSIGANIREAKYAQSRKDFISKLSIALKEANETLYWLEIIQEANTYSVPTILHLLKEINEILPMLVQSIKTAKSRQ